MLRYKCLVMDHDDTVVQSEKTVNFPCFQMILKEYRPNVAITLQEYTEGCYQYGFADFCRKQFDFTEQEIIDEYKYWQEYIREHFPQPFPGIRHLLERQKSEGGLICVVSHSCEENITRDYNRHFQFEPDAIYGWDLPEHLRKPSVYPLEQIMQKYSLTKKDLLIVDDMKPAYEMAAKAGVDIAFAAWSRDYAGILNDEMRKLCTFSFDSPAALEHFLFDDLTDMV